jgi:hypothetical protein
MQRRSFLQSLVAGLSGALAAATAEAHPSAAPEAAPDAAPEVYPPAVFVPDPDAPTRITWWSGVAGAMIRERIPVWGFLSGEPREDGVFPARQIVMRRSDGFYHQTRGWLHVFGRPIARWQVYRPEQLGMDPAAVPDVDLEE